MLGAIAGDIAGSIYEWHNVKSKDIPLFTEKCFFTDDSVLTVALADTILSGTPYAENLKNFYQLYPAAGYGGSFHKWAQSANSEPYNSWGNGAAMRISPAGWAFNDLDTVLKKAEEFTAVTHNHPEGIKGGQATAAAIFLARTGRTKEEIRRYIETQFGYDLSRHVDEIRPSYTYDVSSQGTVPQAVRSFLDATDFEDALRMRTHSAMPFRWAEILIPSLASPAALPRAFTAAFLLGSRRRSIPSWMRGLGRSPSGLQRNTAENNEIA